MSKSAYEDYPDFNEYLDGINKDIEIDTPIGILLYKPSEVLYKTDVLAYEEALNKYQEEKIEELKGTVINTFPNPVAYNFRRSQKGAANDIQRTFYLRDTWESIIHLLFAMALGEFRSLSIPLDIKKSKKEFINKDDIFSDRLNLKIFIIEELCKLGSNKNLDLVILKVIPEGVTDKLRILNKSVRNPISHSNTMSETQAQEIYKKNIDQVLSVLEDLKELQKVKIIRYLGSKRHMCSLNCEIFEGHALDRTIDDIVIADNSLVTLNRHTKKPSILLVYEKDYIYSLSPFIYYKEIDEGHQTRLCFYKQCIGDSYNFEVVGLSGITDKGIIKVNKSVFDIELNELKALLGSKS